MPAASRPVADLSTTLAHVRDALTTLRYGTITLTVHDGVVVQIERSERTRFDR
jgi:hypothetical protein